MWRKVLSWIALVANVLAVIFNVGILVYVWIVERVPNQNPVARALGVVIVGMFLLSGPVVSIFAVLMGSPILRRDPVPKTADVFG